VNLIRSTDPAATALVLGDKTHLSYGELESDVARIQKILGGRSLVFCLCNNDRASLTFYLAALCASHVPLLLPGSIDLTLLRNLLDIYEPRHLIHNRVDISRLGLGASKLDFCGYMLLELHQSSECSLHCDLALLMTTSGSTGSAKLVRLSQKNLLSNAESISAYLGLNERERAMVTMPMHYAYGLSVINSHLMSGASLVLTDHSVMESRFWKFLCDERVTSMSGVPFFYEMLVKLHMDRLDFGSVRTLTQAGGAMSPDKVRFVDACCKSKGISFITMYGQTEATARMTYLHPDEIQAKAGSIGRAIPGGEIWLEDENGNEISGPGVSGELVYRGANVSLGYAEKRADLALGDARGGVLQTGDMARRDEDGYVWITGRKNRFVKLYGHRVSLDAVELMLQSDGLDVAVIGDDDLLVVIIAGTVPGFEVGLRQSLARRTGINPAAIRVQALGELPRLANCKVDYRALRGYVGCAT